MTKPKPKIPPPTGVRVMPIEATHDMIEAAYTLLPVIGSEARAKAICAELYRVMVENAPAEKRGGLSPRQSRVLEVLTEWIDSHNGIAPTYRELAAALGDGGHSEAFRTIGTLKRKGYVDRGWGVRNIRVLIRPEQV